MGKSTNGFLGIQELRKEVNVKILNQYIGILIQWEDFSTHGVEQSRIIRTEKVGEGAKETE